LPAKDAKQFLANYLDITDLQEKRIPSRFDQLARGKEPQDLSSKIDKGIVQF
jgi:hypothetical protein